MKKTLMCATAVAAFASASLVAQAEEGWYGRADVGYIFDGKMDHDAERDVLYTLAGDSDTDNAISLDLGLGYGFDNGFRLEGVIDHRNGDLEVSDGINGGIPADINLGTARTIYSQHQKGDLQIWDLMLNGLYDFNREGQFQPYVGVGIGAAKVKAKASNLAAVTVDPVGTTIVGAFSANGFNDSETAFAYQGLAGIGYSLSERLKLDLGYKYFAVDDLDFNGIGPLGEARVYDSDYRDHSVTLGLRYAFGAPAAPPPPPPPTQLDAPVAAACSTVNQSFVVYFEWDKADLTSQASAVVDQAIANIAARSDCSTGGVTIVGHTDTSGSSAYNQRLSANRAAVVAAALQTRGIASGAINTAARGEDDLAKSTRDGVREPLNRRSEVTIVVQ